ncbi:hypothetical protein F5Y04DRAFT_210062 [Hypomontagnella monticulosa]|nr:hypothetical protein F5Y04DRAFT_210062 [Hypomontagnella monticulosa]
MPKNQGKGGKNRRRGKKWDDAEGGPNGPKRELLFKEADQEYALVEKALGNMRFKVRLLGTTSSEEADLAESSSRKREKGQQRLAILRGKMRKRTFVHKGDFVLVALRDFEEDKVDIIHLYNFREVKRLIELDELPASALSLAQELEDKADGKEYHTHVDFFETEKDSDDEEFVDVDNI